MTLISPLKPAPPRWSEVLRDAPAFPVILVTVAGHMALFGMLTPVMATHAQSFGVPGWQIGLMITLFAAGRLAADLPAGVLAGRYGLRMLLVGGPLLCGLGGLIGGLATDYPTVLAGRTVQGVGSGLYMTAATIAVARMSSASSRGKLMAMHQGAMLVGAAIGPSLGGWTAALWGAEGPFLAGAAIGFATALAAAVMMSEPHGDANRRGHGPVASLLRSAPFVAVLAVNFTTFLTRTVGHWQILPLMAVERFNAGPEDIGLALTLSALGTFAVLPLAARLIERTPRVPLITLSLLASAACLGVVVAAPDMSTLMWGMVAMGAATGIAGPAVAAYAVEITDPADHGPAMGALRFAGDMGYLVGPLSFGFIMDLTGLSQSGGLALNAVLVAMAALLFLAAHRGSSAPRYD